MTALLVTGCSTSRKATSVETVSDVRSKTEDLKSLMSEVRNELENVCKDSVMVEVHDTLTITKTITIRENEQGDTIRMSVVTDRERLRSMYDVRSKSEELKVKSEELKVKSEKLKVKSEESKVKNSLSRQTSSISHILKLIFGILVCVIILVLTFKVKKMFNI